MPSIKTKIDDDMMTSFTPMIDVVFLLLIFFILQPFKSPDRRIDSELSKDDGTDPGPPPTTLPIRIRVDVDPTNPDSAFYRISDGRTIHGGMSNAIAEELIRVSGGDKLVPVTIFPSPRVRFKYVLAALDMCKKAGMEKVKFEKAE